MQSLRSLHARAQCIAPPARKNARLRMTEQRPCFPIMRDSSDGRGLRNFQLRLELQGGS